MEERHPREANEMASIMEDTTSPCGGAEARKGMWKSQFSPAGHGRGGSDVEYDPAVDGLRGRPLSYQARFETQDSHGSGRSE